jgi:hypothetical protein
MVLHWWPSIAPLLRLRSAIRLRPSTSLARPGQTHRSTLRAGKGHASSLESGKRAVRCACWLKAARQLRLRWLRPRSGFQTTTGQVSGRRSIERPEPTGTPALGWYCKPLRRPSRGGRARISDAGRDGYDLCGRRHSGRGRGRMGRRGRPVRPWRRDCVAGRVRVRLLSRASSRRAIGLPCVQRERAGAPAALASSARRRSRRLNQR